MYSNLAIVVDAGSSIRLETALVLVRDSSFAVAFIARRRPDLEDLAQQILQEVPDAVFEAFLTDRMDDDVLRDTFHRIETHPKFSGLSLDLAVFQAPERYRMFFPDQPVMRTALTFSRLAIERILSENTEPHPKKGNLIFTGTSPSLESEAFFWEEECACSIRMLCQAIECAAEEYFVKVCTISLSEAISMVGFECYGVYELFGQACIDLCDTGDFACPRDPPPSPVLEVVASHCGLGNRQRTERVMALENKLSKLELAASEDEDVPSDSDSGCKLKMEDCWPFSQAGSL